MQTIILELHIIRINSQYGAIDFSVCECVRVCMGVCVSVVCVLYITS